MRLKKILVGVGALGSITLGGLAFTACPSCVLSFGNTTTYEAGISALPEEVPPQTLKVVHNQTPEAVKAVYISACGAGSTNIRAHIMDMLDTTELNSIIIDIKDYTGTVSFITDTINISDGTGCRVKDMKEYIEELHARNVYVIGRITVFQDPLYTKQYPAQAVQSKSRPGEPWKDYKGLSFVEVASKQYWDRVVDIARASHEIGFDELNFDYVRYPSDGPMSDAVYTHANESRAEELEHFFAYLTQKVRRADAWGHTPVLSADLFGMTTTNTDDLTIGQVLERALPYFDYIGPMVYPSHYPTGFNGLGNPNKNVYAVIKYSMDRAVERTIATETTVPSFAYEQKKSINEVGEQVVVEGVYVKPSYDKNKIRPWLQDFDYGGDYGPTEVRAQIQATYDSGLNSWMLWDASNKYTPSALHAE